MSDMQYTSKTKGSTRPEQCFRAWFGSFITSNKGFAQDIESGSTGLGISDGYYILPDTETCFWVEFKVVKSISKPIPFEPGQLNWINKHVVFGGKSLIIVLCGATVYVMSPRCIDRTNNNIKPDCFNPSNYRDSMKFEKKEASKMTLAGLELIINNVCLRF